MRYPQLNIPRFLLLNVEFFAIFSRIIYHNFTLIIKKYLLTIIAERRKHCRDAHKSFVWYAHSKGKQKTYSLAFTSVRSIK